MARPRGTTTPTTPFSVHLPAEQIERLQAEAERMDRSMAWLIRKAIEDLFSSLDDQRQHSTSNTESAA